MASPFGLRHVKMPPGYKIIQLDSGHWMWVRERDDIESVIHWDKWAIYRGAWDHYKLGVRPGVQR